MERFAQRVPTVGGTFIQMEDELAASITLQGAVWAGAKAFTDIAHWQYLSLCRPEERMKWPSSSAEYLRNVSRISFSVKVLSYACEVKRASAISSAMASAAPAGSGIPVMGRPITR